MSLIDPAIVEALGTAIYADAEGVDLDEQVAVLTAVEDALVPLIADAVKAACAKAWDEGFIARTGDTPLYRGANEWGNPYRAEVTR